MSELVKIDAKDYGLEETKAKEISDMFKPMLDKMVELEKEFNTLAKGEISKELCIEAKALRKKYVKVRVGTSDIHKDLKKFYLQGGRFVDGWKNAQLMASGGIEGKLMSIEKHYENLEAEKISKLQEKRAKELEKFEVDFVPGNLGEMQDEVWSNYISGVKLNYQAKIDAEKKAKEERIQKEKEAALQRTRAIESSPYSDFINWNGTDFGKMNQPVYDRLLSEAKKKKSDHEAKQEQIRKDNLRLQREAEQREEKRLADKKIADDKAEKLRKDNEAALQKIQDEKDQVAKELEEKRLADEKVEAARLTWIEAEKTKDDSDKVNDLISDLKALKTKYRFTSHKNKGMYSDVCDLLDKVVEHIRK